MLTLASLVVTFIAAGAGIYFYQRARRSMILLHDGAKFYESLRQELNRANSRISVLESEKVALTSDAETARKAHRDASSRAANAESEFLHMQTTLERKLANAELQRDHILNRYETLQAAEDQNIEARNELDATIKSLEAERVTLRAQRDDARQAASLNLKSENSDLRRRVNDLEREIAQAKSRQEIDPKAHDALRRRANHNEQLYHSMKSLRDMADELVFRRGLRVAFAGGART